MYFSKTNDLHYISPVIFFIRGAIGKISIFFYICRQLFTQIKHLYYGIT